MIISKPKVQELSSYYQSYLKYVPEDNMLQSLSEQQLITQNFLQTIPGGKADLAYAEGKWMLKEVIGHLCDTERILTCRALRFSRNDKTPLSSFDENLYTPNSNYANLPIANIAGELNAIRTSSVFLFTNMSEEMFDREGVANRTEVSVRAILFFILAHERHHLKVIKEKYLS